MRIVNTGYAPRYLSYGDTVTGGKTLNPGQESRDLPLSYVHSTVLWKDLDKGVVQLRLNDEDKAFLRKILESGEKPITLMQPPAPPAPPPPPKPPAEKPQLQPVLVDTPPQAEVTAGQEAVKRVMEAMRYTEIKPSGAPSLGDLMKANKTIPAPGAPSFVDKGKKASMSEIATHMGSRL